MSKLRSATKKESKSPTLDRPVSGSPQDSDDLPPPAPRVEKEEESMPPPSKRSSSPSVSNSIAESMDLKPKTEHTNVKPEPKSSRSQSPDMHFKGSPSPTPPPTTAASSKASTPPLPAPAPAANSKKVASAPQLIGDLPVARTDALSTFKEIRDNCYQYKTLGRSREVLESMTCDCSYEHGVDSPEDACGPHSDCINRLTQVECLEEDCRCRSYCQNQRFQNKEYADIEIVKTEMKGFGLRAESDITKDSFIYEYVGDVVNPASFKKRMRDYAAEGIEHFYFMMLQKDEFIDATKSGGIGRFANHSCSPNCYVAKWTIGNHVRMGIFAKRNIKKHEELTFNYNVDRYGHQAQICYCGEPNCVGYIGGKTQTDIATMDDLYLDALGITDEADVLELKGTKKKKGKKIDDPDFMPQMKPIVEKDVPKVVQAIRQTQSRKVLSKLLTRIKITEDQGALRQIMRLRGYSLMTNVLEDYPSDIELVTLSLGCMMSWPLLNRNKVDDSKVSVPVQACTELDNETVKELAQKLLDHWETLPKYNRIPKRVKQAGEEEDNRLPYITVYKDESDRPPMKRSKWDTTTYFEERDFRIDTSEIAYMRIPPTVTTSYPSREEVYASREAKRETIKAIIANAAAEKAAAEAAAAEAAAAAVAAKEAAAAAKLERKKQKPPKKVQTPEEKEANKEKRLMKLVGAVVVKCMSKYAKSLDHDSFKKHAKELTKVIADKEKKSTSYKEGKLEALSDEKVVKIKKFAKDYISKILRKLEKSGKRLRPPSSTATQATSSASMTTPNSADDDRDVVMADISVEEAMDLDTDDHESMSEGEEEEERDDHHDSGTSGHDPETSVKVIEHPQGEVSVTTDAANESMDTEETPNLSKQPSDPRRRPPMEGRGLHRPTRPVANGVSMAS